MSTGKDVFRYFLWGYFLSPEKHLSISFMRGIAWLQDFGEGGWDLGAPMIHVQPSFQSHVSPCLFLFLLRIKLQTLIWGWLGCASHPLWRCCPAPCDGGGHGRSVWCRYSCQPIPCFSFWSLSTPPWYLVSWHYSLGSKLASFLEVSPAGALRCGFFYCAESHSTLLHCAELLLFHSIEYSCLLSSTLLFSLPMWVHTPLNFKKSRSSFHWQFNWFFKRLSSSEVKSKLP